MIPQTDDEWREYRLCRFRHYRNGDGPRADCVWCQVLSIIPARRDLDGSRRPAGIAPYGSYELPEILRAERDARRREWLADSQDEEEAA